MSPGTIMNWHKVLDKGELPEGRIKSVTADHQNLALSHFECTRQSVLMSGYLGSIGFGQYMGEPTTAVKYGMNITHVLLNNCELGKISKEQRHAELDVWQTSLHNPDFAAFATNCGALGIRVTSKDQLGEARSRALAHEGPSLVEIMSDVELI